MLEDRLDALFKMADEYVVIERMKGEALVGRKYQPLFPYFAHLKSSEPDKGAFRVVRCGGMQCSLYAVCLFYCFLVFFFFGGGGGGGGGGLYPSLLPPPPRPHVRIEPYPSFTYYCFVLRLAGRQKCVPVHTHT